ADGRGAAGAPRVGGGAAIMVSSEDEADAREAARQIGGARPDLPDVMILGPAPAPLSLLRGRYRYRLLINARRSAQLQDIIRQWLGALSFPQGVRVAVDIDPYSFV
ncbi:MAG: primosomal protein N', partial [Novosphingobium sp.]